MTKRSWTGNAIWFLFSVLMLFSLIIGIVSYSMSTKNPWLKILRRKLNDNEEESEEETDESSDSSMMSLLKYYEEEHEEVSDEKVYPREFYNYPIYIYICTIIISLTYACCISLSR
jgi:hypothetical protein